MEPKKARITIDLNAEALARIERLTTRLGESVSKPQAIRTSLTLLEYVLDEIEKAERLGTEVPPVPRQLLRPIT
jgi:hypothetical protein